VLVSADTVAWDVEGTITQKSLYGVARDEHQLVTVGVEGVILRGQAGPLAIIDYRRVNGTNSLILSGPPGSTVTVQASENIRTWSNLATQQFLDNNGRLVFLDTRNTTPSRQTFRGRMP